MGYSKTAYKGISWIGTLRLSIRAIAFLRIAIIARLLSPSQFGIFSIAALILAFTEIATDTGINIFLIQKKDNISKYINSAWVVSIARGFLMFIAILVFSQFAPAFFSAFNQKSLYEILFIASFVPIIKGFINPSNAKFLKELNYKKEFIYRTSIFFVESLSAVILVFYLLSPIGLILALVVGAIFELFLSFMFVKPTPKLRFEYSILTEFIKKGKWFTVSGIFNYLYQQADSISVGKLLGPSSLGLYDAAYKISLLPISEITDVVGKATFPIYVKFSEDRIRLKRAYLKSLTAVTVLVLVLGGLFLVFPQTIIKIVLGEKWIDAAGALQVLAILGILRGISTTINAPFYATEKQNIVAFINLISFLGLIVTIVPLIYMWGIIGAATSAIIGILLSLPFAVWFAIKLMK